MENGMRGDVPWSSDIKSVLCVYTMQCKNIVEQNYFNFRWRPLYMF